VNLPKEFATFFVQLKTQQQKNAHYKAFFTKNVAFYVFLTKSNIFEKPTPIS
jgi:hypothetical protein